MPYTPVSLSYYDLLIALVLVGACMVLSWRLQVGLEHDLGWGAVRAFAQLTVMGLVLGVLFTHQQWYWVLLALAVMLGVAVHTAAGRVKAVLPGKAAIFTLALALGSLSVLAFVTLLVLRVDTWYDARYVITLAGMIVNNAMVAATLAVSRYADDLRRRRREVETALALGATAMQAAAPIRRDALRTGILPSVNSMLVVGIVALPGMMTGQIIAGQDPAQAVRYQVMVTYMITAAATFTSALAVLLAVRQTFTPAHQLRVEETAAG